MSVPRLTVLAVLPVQALAAVEQSLPRRMAGKALLAALVAALLVTLSLQGAVREYLLYFVVWVRELGAMGALLYGLAYIAATVALVPGSALTLTAGFVYGPYWASGLVLVSSVLGASAAFLLSRTWLRPWSASRFAGSPVFLSLDEQLGREGWKLVFLLRLSPVVPFSVLNYVLGLTKVSLRGYVMASAVGMIPGIVLYCYLGSLMSSIGQLDSAGDSLAARFAFWGGMAATLVVTVVLTRWARRALALVEASRESHV